MRNYPPHTSPQTLRSHVAAFVRTVVLRIDVYVPFPGSPTEERFYGTVHHRCNQVYDRSLGNWVAHLDGEDALHSIVCQRFPSLERKPFTVRFNGGLVTY